MLVNWKTRLRMAAAFGFGLGLFWLAGPTVNPSGERLDAFSMFEGGSALYRVAQIVVLGLAAEAAGAVIAPFPPVFGALFGIAGGVLWLSLRSGPAFAIFWAYPDGRLFGELAAGMLILALLLAAGFLVNRQMGRLLKGLLTPNEPEEMPMTPNEEKSVVQRLWAAALNVVGAAILLKLTLATAERGQVIFALIASFYCSTVFAHQVSSCRHAYVYLVGPPLVALAGYVLALAGVYLAGQPFPLSPANLAPNFLVRALPIDYASAGTLGVLMGLVTSFRIQYARALERGGEE
jgi:hypothetical protein